MRTYLQNEALHQETVSAAKNEKAATFFLLERLAEVDATKLYAVMGYASLWEYVHRALQYSESQASERVSAMRLTVKIPEVKKELENGNLSLTTAAKLASHVRREKTDEDEALVLLKAVSGKSSREVEKILKVESNTATKTTRITIDVDQAFLELMTRMKELSGHPGSTPEELFKLAMQSFVKKKEIPQTSAKTESTLRAQKVTQGQDAAKKEYKNHSRYIPVATKIKIRVRSGDQCEYQSPDGRRCTSKHSLEYDHIQAYAKGGITEFENLRHYCAAHNRLSAIQQFGEKKMREFLRQ
jgi:hypothetical protein